MPSLHVSVKVIDFDKLNLEVWTNGIISAQEAVSLAAKILTEHLNLFVDLSDAGGECQRLWWKKTIRAKKKCLK